MEPIHLLILVPLATLTPTLGWYVAVHLRRERRRAAARVEALRWIARNMNAPSLRDSILSVDDDGCIRVERQR